MPNSTPGTFSDFFSQVPSEIFALGFVFIGIFMVCIVLIILLRLRRLGSGSTRQPNALELANEQLARAYALSESMTHPDEDAMPDLDMLLGLGDIPQKTPPPAGVQVPIPTIELSMSHDASGRLVIQLADTVIREGDTIPIEAQIKLEALLAELNLLLYPTPAPTLTESMNPSQSNTSINPFFDFLPSIGIPDGSSPFVLDEPITDRDPTPIPIGGYPAQNAQSKSSAILQETDVASQINSLLQELLKNHPIYQGRSIQLRGGAGGTIRILIEHDMYENVKDIPDKQIQLLIGKAVKAWQTLNS